MSSNLIVHVFFLKLKVNERVLSGMYWMKFHVGSGMGVWLNGMQVGFVRCEADAILTMSKNVKESVWNRREETSRVYPDARHVHVFFHPLATALLWARCCKARPKVTSCTACCRCPNLIALPGGRRESAVATLVHVTSLRERYCDSRWLVVVSFFLNFHP